MAIRNGEWVRLNRLKTIRTSCFFSLIVRDNYHSNQKNHIPLKTLLILLALITTLYTTANGQGEVQGD
ncbi:MAG: hypothetical protein R3283_11055, partial [Balneolaceae bacterium]|nr:hypothetical protein [Balneolaceae bacterium]